MSKHSLRQCINDNCKNCIYDDTAAGTWLQQVTLCSVKSCALYSVRPVSKSPIPEIVLDSYLITGAEREFYRLSRPLEAPVSKHNESKEYQVRGVQTQVTKRSLLEESRQYRNILDCNQKGKADGWENYRLSPRSSRRFL